LRTTALNYICRRIKRAIYETTNKSCFLSQWISVPFVLTNPAVSNIIETAQSNHSWLGTWDNNYAGYWIDSTLVLVSSWYDLPVFCDSKIFFPARQLTELIWLHYILLFGVFFLRHSVAFHGKHSGSESCQQRALKQDVSFVSLEALERS